jgi:hypothetical protein
VAIISIFELTEGRMKKPVYNLGDLIDRLTILTRKIYFGDDTAISEHRHLEKSLKAFGIDGKLVTNTIRIAQANIEIWNLENEIRNGGEDNLGLEEVGRRALKIRDINKKRIAYKNNITAIDRGFPETKINHRSC